MSKVKITVVEVEGDSDAISAAMMTIFEMWRTEREVADEPEAQQADEARGG